MIFLRQSANKDGEEREEKDFETPLVSYKRQLTLFYASRSFWTNNFFSDKADRRTCHVFDDHWERVHCPKLVD